MKLINGFLLNTLLIIDRNIMLIIRFEHIILMKVLPSAVVYSVNESQSTRCFVIDDVKDTFKLFHVSPYLFGIKSTNISTMGIVFRFSLYDVQKH